MCGVNGVLRAWISHQPHLPRPSTHTPPACVQEETDPRRDWGGDIPSHSDKALAQVPIGSCLCPRKGMWQPNTVSLTSPGIRKDHLLPMTSCSPLHLCDIINSTKRFQLRSKLTGKICVILGICWLYSCWSWGDTNIKLSCQVSHNPAACQKERKSLPWTDTPELLATLCGRLIPPFFPDNGSLPDVGCELSASQVAEKGEQCLLKTIFLPFMISVQNVHRAALFMPCLSRCWTWLSRWVKSTNNFSARMDLGPLGSSYPDGKKPRLPANRSSSRYEIIKPSALEPRGFPGGTGVKSPPANAKDWRDVGLIPGSGRSPGVRNATHSSILATVYGVAKSRTRLSNWAHTFGSSRPSAS